VTNNYRAELVGAIAFEMWTGQPAPEAVMKAALQKAFSL
jgi:shikimate 5-dehydrogenase